MNKKWAQYSKMDAILSHACEHYEDFNDLTDTLPGFTVWDRFRSGVIGFFLVTGSNYRTFGYLRSRMAIEQEKSRQLRAYFYMIHPFSRFRLYWEIFMIVVLYYALLVQPVHTTWRHAETSVLTHSLIGVAAVTGVDMCLSLFTGVNQHDTKEIIMHQSNIVCKYLRGMFIFDAVCVFPYCFFYSREASEGHIVTQDGEVYVRMSSYWRVASFLSVFRLLRLIKYTHNTLQAYNLSYLKRKIVTMVLVTIVSIHTITCGNFYGSLVYYENANGLLPFSSWIMQLQRRHLNVYNQYLYSMLRTMGITLGICFNYFLDTEKEQYMSLLMILIGQILYYRLIAEVTNITRTQQASSSKYEEMTVQLHQFMTYKKLPLHIKNKVLEYYDFRFYKTYFVEAEIMGSVSEKIRQEITRHNCSRLVEKVQFFSDLPADLKMRIVACMRTAYYLADDTIIDVNDKSDCMYFIKTGTVGVYSINGKEICHLEDGDNFGEVSLILEKVNRSARVVALECCELLLLGRKAFLKIGVLESHQSAEVMFSS